MGRARAWIVLGAWGLASILVQLSGCGDDVEEVAAGPDGATDGGGGATDGSTTLDDGGSTSDAPSIDAAEDADASTGDAGHAWVYFAGGASGTTFNGFAWEPTMRKLTPLDVEPDAAGVQGFTSGQGPIAVAAHPNGAFVYTANFQDDSISAFTHDAANGLLTRMVADDGDAAGVDLTVGTSPVFIAADPKGRCLYVARQVAFLDTVTINPANGKLTLARQTPSASIAQWIAVDPAARFLVVGGTGGQLMIHRLDATTGLPLSVDGGVGTGTAYSVPANSYQVALRPDGTVVYVAASSTNEIRAFSIDPISLALTVLPSATDAGFPVAIAVDPAGKFLYTAQASIDVRALAANGTVGPPLGNVASGGQCVALTIVPGGQTLFGHCFGGGAIVPIDPLTGAMSPRTSGGFGTSRNAAWVVR